ncbi:MAG: TRAP transporter fused permease subunit [Sphingobium sp.]
MTETKKEWSDKLRPLIVTISILLAAAHLAQVNFYIFSSGQFLNININLSSVLLFALFYTKSDSKIGKIFCGIGLILALVTLAYIHIEDKNLSFDRSIYPAVSDIVIASTMLVIILILTIHFWGWLIPILTIVALFYAKYGFVFANDLLFHNGISWQRLISYTSIPYYRGALGGLTTISAYAIFVFMLYAGFLTSFGGLDFLISLARRVAGRSRAGPAQVAIAATALMGTVSGSSVANVASTGTFTIPMMRRHGFSPHFSGGVEAVGSTGGQIMPPIMGVTAFLIVAVTGIKYSEIITAGLVPALIYFGGLAMAVHLRAHKIGLAPSNETAPEGAPPFTNQFMSQLGFVLSVLVLVVLLVTQFSPGYSASIAIAILVMSEFIKAIVKPAASLAGSIKDFFAKTINGVVEGASTGAKVAVMVGVIGIFVEIFIVTGFAQKLSHLMLLWADGNLVVLVLLTGLSCILFGFGMPTSAAYTLVALLAAPALLQLGVPLLAAHFFVFYLACMSSITPPVAIASLIASNIAGASYMRTALASVRLGLSGFLLPFLFIAHPQIIGINATWIEHLLYAIGAFLSIASLYAAIEGFLITPLNWSERVGLIVVSAGLIYPGLVYSLAAFGLFLIIIMNHVFRSKRIKLAEEIPI